MKVLQLLLVLAFSAVAFGRYFHHRDIHHKCELDSDCKYWGLNYYYKCCTDSYGEKYCQIEENCPLRMW
jgi:hypothetical protein